MAVSNISWATLFTNNGVDSTVTIARPGGKGFAIAEVQLVWVSSAANAQAWISGQTTQPSPDQVLHGISPDPGGSAVISFIGNCLSADFSLRVSGGWAAAIAKMTAWN
jgi:hypothetical protein